MTKSPTYKHCTGNETDHIQRIETLTAKIDEFLALPKLRDRPFPHLAPMAREWSWAETTSEEGYDWYEVFDVNFGSSLPVVFMKSPAVGWVLNKTGDYSFGVRTMEAFLNVIKDLNARDGFEVKA